MKYNYAVKTGGKFYKPGEDVPISGGKKSKATSGKSGSPNNKPINADEG